MNVSAGQKRPRPDTERDAFLELAKTWMEAALIVGEPACNFAQPQRDEKDRAALRPG